MKTKGYLWNNKILYFSITLLLINIIYLIQYNPKRTKNIYTKKIDTKKREKEKKENPNRKIDLPAI